MLASENVQSVRARYSDADSSGMIPDWTAIPYVYRDPQYRPAPLEVLQAIAGYEYQSCEHDDWHCSEASRFCQALRLAMVRRLPGYDDAPWTWDQSDLTWHGNSGFGVSRHERARRPQLGQAGGVHRRCQARPQRVPRHRDAHRNQRPTASIGHRDHLVSSLGSSISPAARSTPATPTSHSSRLRRRPRSVS